MDVSEDLLLDSENQDMEDDIVDVEHDVPVIVADPVLEPDFVDVPHIPAVVHQANQYELTWCPSFRFRFPKAFAANVDMSVLDEMVVQTEDGFSMTLEIRQETARWKMLQAGLENGAQFLLRYYRDQNTLRILNSNP
ncbi:uncharacterized protein LOC110901997 [Helianthus annuus]|uniref:uncharacterized protein LOC110901997 n=1 Tax=Helianthus annuus TaxID=4232 RepID=UPI000B8EF1B1|nr:uncharacterized protein LOC110901997 [Helianthus annuus]